MVLMSEVVEKEGCRVLTRRRKAREVYEGDHLPTWEKLLINHLRSK